MPRISLWKENHSNDYRYIDNRIREMFTAGGVGIFIHKLLGTASVTGGSNDATQPTYINDSEKNIQDLLFLENRNRKYEPDIYKLRGHYTLSDNDFNLSQFGMFLNNDTLFITFHINDMIERIGRKLVAGDVLEMPNMKDYWPLDDGVPVPLKKFYVVSEITRAAEGYSVTWWPHLYRVKVQPLVDAQEFKDILNQPMKDSEGNDAYGPNGETTLNEMLSTYNQNLAVNNAIVQQAETEVPKSGYNTEKFFVLPIDDQHRSLQDYITADNIDWTADYNISNTKLNGTPNVTTENLFDVIYANNKFVAVGSNGLIITSTDGVNWTQQTSYTNKNLRRVIYDSSNERFIAVGEQGAILVGTMTAATWTVKNSPSLYNLVDIAIWPGNGYMAVGENGACIVSYDSNQWNTRFDLNYNANSISIIPHSTDYRAVVVFDDGRIYTSDDFGTSWTSRTSNTANNLYGVEYETITATLVAVGYEGTIITSEDNGVTWVAQTSPTNYTLNNVFWKEQQWIAVGNNSTVIVSTDSINWSFSNTDAFAPGQSRVYRSLALNSDATWVFAGDAGALYQYTTARVATPKKGMPGYLVGDVNAPNGLRVTSLTYFPESAKEGEYVLRTDYLPNTLYRYDGRRWTMVHDVQRTFLTGNLNNTLIGTYVNNTATTRTNSGEIINQRQALRDLLSPRSDF